MQTEKFFGIHAVRAILETDYQRVNQLYVSQGKSNPRVKELIAMARKYRLPVITLNQSELDKMTTGNHQGVIAECAATFKEKTYDLEEILQTLSEDATVLLLDGVQDPHNLGACLRSADAAGVAMVIAPKDKSVGMTPVVRKVACGAAESIPFVQVTNLARTIERLQEYRFWFYGLSDKADQSLYDTEFTGRVALVMGAEGAGLRRLTQEKCDALLSIPMHGTVSSLNVSVATAVCLYELVRQRAVSRIK